MNTERRVRCELLGTILTLPARPVRVVSFVPGLTEAIWAMQLQDRVVATSHYCRRHVDAGDRPVAGDYLRIDDAALQAMQPDLVLMTGGVQHGVTRRLAQAGLPVYALPLADSFHGILENIRRLGALLGEMAAAIALTTRMEAEAAALRAANSGKRRRTYTELWFGRFPRCVGGLTYVHDLLTLAGADNIFGHEPAGYLPLDLAAVSRGRPERLVFFWEEDDTAVDVPALLAERGWTGAWPFQVIEAGIQPGRNLIHDGPSCLDTARWLAGVLRRDV